MAQATGVTTGVLLSAAGLSPDQFGTQIALDFPNQSVMLPLVEAYTIDKGKSLYIPKVGTRSVVDRDRGTDEGDTVAMAAMDDSKDTLTKYAAEDRFGLDRMTENDMPPGHLAAWIAAETLQSTAAMANKMDVKLLTDLYSSATTTVGSASTDFSYDVFVEAAKNLRENNARGEIFCVLPENQWDKIASDDYFNRYDFRGEGGTIQNGGMFRAQGITIRTTNNVPTSAGTAQGVMFARNALKLAIRDFIHVEDIYEPEKLLKSLLFFMDFAYSVPYGKHAVKFDLNSTS